jgi:hypothetical protein
MSIWGKDKSGCENRHGGLVKKAVEVLKDAKKIIAKCKKKHQENYIKHQVFINKEE